MPIGIKVKVHDDATRGELRDARRQINRKTREGLRRAGEQAVLPAARAEARPHVGQFASGIVIRATNTKAILTTIGGKRVRGIIGLHNFGGTVTAPILPKSKKAVVVDGQPVARVNTPRSYRGKRFLEKGIRRGLPKFERILLDTIMEAYDGLEHN